MRRRGFTLIEILIVGLITLLVGAGTWTLLRSSYDSQYDLMRQNKAQTYGRQALDTLLDRVRGATAVTAAAASDVTFTDSAGQALRFWRSGTTLRTTTNGLPSGGAQIVRDLQSFTCSYWSWSGSAWTQSSSPSDLSKVGAVQLTVVASVDGRQRQIASTVRIRHKRIE